MKKLIATLLILTMCLGFSTVALANNPTKFINDDAAFVYAWSALRDNGELTVGSDGLLHLAANSTFNRINRYDEVVEMVNLCNDSIQDGILVVNSETLEISSVIQPEEEPIPYGLTNHVDRSDIFTRNGAHGCTIQALNLLTLCENNYNTLTSYYERMLKLSLTNPSLSPWGATFSFWISKVNSGRDWDYKVQPGFSPWYTQFCSYFDGSFNHITSEYIGNFNYGYTGSFLFSLNTLHFGSSAVANFQPADIEDWPAIDAGYENATN